MYLYLRQMKQAVNKEMKDMNNKANIFQATSSSFKIENKNN